MVTIRSRRWTGCSRCVGGYFLQMLPRKCINHGFLVLSASMSPSPVVLDHAFDAATRFQVVSGIGDGLSAFIACKVDTCHQP
jgi:hypothetical protein